MSAASSPVIAVDIDAFDAINARLGDEGGDAVVRQVSARLQACVRSSDRVSRDEASIACFDHHEFSLLCEHVGGVRGAKRLIARIERVFDSPLLLGANSVPVSLRLGITVLRGVRPAPAEVLREARAVLLRARQVGSTRYALFVENANSQRVSMFMTTKRCAAPRARRIPRRVPAQDLSCTDRVVGVEALRRWIHPTRGCIPAELVHPSR